MFKIVYICSILKKLNYEKSIINLIFIAFTGICPG